jgi:hypothetical protein
MRHTDTVRWYRSFYFRIGFTFVLFSVCLLVLQTALVSLVRSRSPLRDRPPNTVVAIVSADLGSLLTQDASADLDAYLKREYAQSQPIYVVLAAGGVASNRTAPLSRPSTVSDSVSRAVTIRIGVTVLAPSARSARQSVIPSTPGSITSSSTTSKRVWRAISSARLPSPTSVMSKPASSRCRRMTSRMAASSSTTSARRFIAGFDIAAGACPILGIPVNPRDRARNACGEFSAAVGILRARRAPVPEIRWKFRGFRTAFDGIPLAHAVGTPCGERRPL